MSKGTVDAIFDTVASLICFMNTRSCFVVLQMVTSLSVASSTVEE